MTVANKSKVKKFVGWRAFCGPSIKSLSSKADKQAGSNPSLVKRAGWHDASKTRRRFGSYASSVAGYSDRLLFVGHLVDTDGGRQDEDIILPRLDLHTVGIAQPE